MDFFVIRNKSKAEELCQLIMQRRLPLKVALQNIYPLRSLNSLDYYWGVVLYYISDATGQSPDECHEGYRVKFNYIQEFRYNPRTRKMQFYIGAGSTIVDEVAFWEFIMKIRADAELELHICIPMPNETFIRELNFDYERTHKTRKI